MALVAVIGGGALGCGGGEPPRTTPVEDDLGLGVVGGEVRATPPEQHESGPPPTPGGSELVGTRWRWVEAHCTEGPLDLARRGYEAEIRFLPYEEQGQVNGNAFARQGFLIVWDQTFTQPSACTQTIIQKALSPLETPEWAMTEEARISLPLTPECEGRPERPRPGDVRHRGGDVEILVQRSQWCNGFEARFVFAPMPTAQLTENQLVRHYFAHFNRRDAATLTSMFAENGSIVDPAQVTESGQPARLDGRATVRAWHDEVFNGAAWSAARLEAISDGANANQRIATWKYMDPRRTEPLTMRTQFTIAAGEIFEEGLDFQPEVDATAPATPAPAANAPAGTTPADAAPAPGTTRPAGRAARPGATPPAPGARPNRPAPPRQSPATAAPNRPPRSPRPAATPGAAAPAPATP